MVAIDFKGIANRQSRGPGSNPQQKTRSISPIPKPPVGDNQTYPGFNVSKFSGELNRTGVAYQSHFLVFFQVPITRLVGRGTSLNSDPGSRNQNALSDIFNEQLSRLSDGNFTWSDGAMQHFALRIDRVNIPGRIIISSPYKEGNYGLTREYPTNAVYQPVDVSVIMSKDFNEKIFFEQWQDLIIGPHRTHDDLDGRLGVRDLNYISNYATSLTIVQFNNLNKETDTGEKSSILENIIGFMFGGGGFRPGDPVPVYSCTLQEAYPRTIQDIQGDWGSNDIHRLNVVFDYKYFKDKKIGPPIQKIARQDPTFFERLAQKGITQGASVLLGDVARRAGLSQKQQAFLTGATTVARQVFGSVNSKYNLI
jgi:hypothetical protein